MIRSTVIVGARDPRSPLRTAAFHAAGALGSHCAFDSGPPEVIDLAELAPLLLCDPADGEIARALDRIGRSEVLLVASPEAHGTYTGLLKVFLDHLPQLGLAHTIAVPMAAVPDLRTGRGIEEDLRLLLADLGAWVVEPGLLLGESELAEPLSVLDAWAEVAAPHLRQALAVRV